MSRRRTFFKNSGSGVSPYNLFLGGMGSIITNATQLASYFSFTEGQVSLFNINGNDVEAFITNTYYLANSFSFFDQDTLTHVIETSGYMYFASTRSFDNCSNLALFQVARANFLFGQRSLRLCANLSPDNIIVNTISGGSNQLSAFENIGSGTFDFSRNTSYNNGGQSVRQMFKRTSNPASILDFRNCTSFIITGTSTAPYIFDEMKGTVRLWSCTTFMSTPASVVSLCGIYPIVTRFEINVSQKTSNGGAEHASFAGLRALGCTIVFTDTDGTIIP